MCRSHPRPRAFIAVSESNGEGHGISRVVGGQLKCRALAPEGRFLHEGDRPYLAECSCAFFKIAIWPA
jgi:hypothetical protein